MQQGKDDCALYDFIPCSEKAACTELWPAHSPPIMTHSDWRNHENNDKALCNVSISTLCRLDKRVVLVICFYIQLQKTGLFSLHKGFGMIFFSVFFTILVSIKVSLVKIYMFSSSPAPEDNKSFLFCTCVLWLLFFLFSLNHQFFFNLQISHTLYSR